MARVIFPGTQKKDREFKRTDEAIEFGLRAADEHTVEVRADDGEGEEGEGTLLARYERRDAPLYSGDGPFAPPEPETPEE